MSEATIIARFYVEFFRQWVRIPTRQVPSLGPVPEPCWIEVVNFGSDAKRSFGYRFAWANGSLRSCGAPSSCASNEGAVWFNQYGSLEDRTREEIVEFCASAARDFLRANGWSVKNWSAA